MGVSPVRSGMFVVTLVGAVLVGAPAPAEATTEVQLNSTTDVKWFEIDSTGTNVVYAVGPFLGQQTDLFSVPIGGGPSTKLNDQPLAGPVLLTPDGSRVVYVGGPSFGTTAAYSVPIGGGPPVKLIDGSGNVAISPDSKWFVISALLPGGGSGLFSVPIAGGAPVQLDLERAEFHISPDATRVVYWNIDGLQVVPIGGGTPLLLDTQTASPFGVSPDALRVVYPKVVGGKTALFSVSITGGAPVQLSPDPGPGQGFQNGQFAFSPDGKSVAFTFNPFLTGTRELLGVPTAGGPTVTLTPPPDLSRVNIRSFAVSPDSQSVVVDFTGQPQPGLHRGTFATGHRNFLVPSSGRPFAFSPDGATLAFFGSLQTVPIDGGTPTELDDITDLTSVTYTPGGTRIVYDDNGFERFVIPAGGGTRTKITEVFATSQQAVQVSGTGGHVVFMKFTSGGAGTPGRTDLFSWADPAGPDAPGGPPPLPPGPGGGTPPPPPPPPGPPGPPGTQVGLVDPAQGQWHLRNTAGQVTSFFFGNPGDVPVIGDWDCNGTDTPGLFRTSDAFAYLSNANRSQIADVRFFFGNPSDVPLAGDWDGDGCDTLSIYRPGEQRFFIINQLGRNEGGLGAADFDFFFGNPGDKPVVGDWDADGVDEVGLHRESTGFFYWRETLTTGIADGTMFFGDPNDRFVAGDWGTVDGADTPAIFRPSNATFFFRHTLTQGVADSQVPFGQAAWLPVAGEFGLG